MFRHVVPVKCYVGIRVSGNTGVAHFGGQGAPRDRVFPIISLIMRYFSGMTGTRRYDSYFPPA
jgi:hypothetical protein